MHRRILDTPPMHTPTRGPGEVRVLTWRRDWVNCLWALKSFYRYSPTDLPLVIHDGGLSEIAARTLLRHFPDATFVSIPDADAQVGAALLRQGLTRCRKYRGLHPMCRKLFDFFVLSRADYVLSFDSDVLFFRRPDELLNGEREPRANLYNRDCGYAYTLPLDDLERRFGVRPPPRINAGMSFIWRESIHFEAVEEWLGHPALFSDRWVTEQTLHAMCAARFGVQFLSDAYLVSTVPGMPEGLVAKHYPGVGRDLLYHEGMARLVREGFLDALRAPRA